MEFAITKEVLTNEMNQLQSVIDKEVSIPVLESIKIESSGNNLKLIATCMETTIHSTLTSKMLAVSAQGAACLPAKRLLEIVRLLPAGPLKISSGADGWLKIIAKKSSFKIPAHNVSTFPDLPTPDDVDEWINLPGKTLREMIPAVRYAVSGEKARLNLQGAKLEVEGSNLRLVATDGHRVSLVSTELDKELDDFGELIPVAALDELAKLLVGYDDEIGVGKSENGLFFGVGTRVLHTRLMTVKFPSYQMPFKDLGTYETSGTFKANELIPSIKRMMTCAQKDKKTKAASLKFEFENGSLVISSSDSDLGEAKEVLETNFEGDMSITLNGSYLIDYLEPLGEREVKIEIKDARSQVYLSSESNGISTYYCCMPMAERK
jgi:DNA polymerase-3 subunit beta